MKPKYERIEPGEGRALQVLSIAQPAFDAEWHFHPEWELTLIVEGEGRRFVADSIEPFKAGDFVLVGPGLPHFWHSQAGQGGESPSRAVVVQFPAVFPGDGLLELPEMRPLRTLFGKARRGVVFEGAPARRAAEALQGLPGLAGPAAVVRLLGVLGELATCRARRLAGEGYIVDASEEGTSRMGRAYACLMAHFRNPGLSLGEVAAAAAMSPAAFSRFFKRVSGRGLWDFLVELRIDHAAALLRETTDGVTQIAMESGFGSLSSFNRHFQKRHRCAPRDYRRAGVGA
jgi:AraC-like DNA-binding protein/mannose-6-phosphate isomerase-like protein (cupin superfamily)